MVDAFNNFLAFICGALPVFLMAEPVIYFVGAALSLVVLTILLRLVHTRF